MEKLGGIIMILKLILLGGCLIRNVLFSMLSY
jgi:hypothetical protein